MDKKMTETVYLRRLYLVDKVGHLNTVKSICASILVACSFSAYAAPDEDKMGKSNGYPACNPGLARMECRVGFHSLPMGRRIEASSKPLQLEFAENSPKITFRWGFSRITAQEYFESQKATGLLILKDGKVVHESYQYDRKPTTIFRSNSMAKTVTALLIGIAKDKGFIKSLDDASELYFPDIAGTAFGETTIKNLLRMSSGVNYQETYTWLPDSDLMKLLQFLNNGGNQSMIDAAKYFNNRTTEQGLKFNYAGIQTEILARVLTKATGKNMTTLTKEWIWEPMGAEHASYWQLPMMGDGVENSAGGFYASLRDWGRLGMLLANDGEINGNRIISKQYLLEATDSSLQPSNFKPKVASNYFGYGYQTWLFPMRKRTFALIGIYGQSVYVQPESKIVMVQTSVYDNASGDPMNRQKNELWSEVLNQLGGDSSQ